MAPTASAGDDRDARWCVLDANRCTPPTACSHSSVEITRLTLPPALPLLRGPPFPSARALIPISVVLPSPIEMRPQRHLSLLLLLFLFCSAPAVPPATKDGQPIRTCVPVEVSLRFY